MSVRCGLPVIEAGLAYRSWGWSKREGSLCAGVAKAVGPTKGHSSTEYGTYEVTHVHLRWYCDHAERTAVRSLQRHRAAI